MSEDLRQSLATELATDLARAIEAMTSEQPKLSLASDPPPPGSEHTTWRQNFTATGGAAWLTASETTWISIGSRTLRAAGIEDGDDETSKSTFIEILGQAFSMLARSLSGRTNIEWGCTDGKEFPELPGDVKWTSIHLEFADGLSESLFIAFDQDVLRDLVNTPGLSLSKPPPTVAPPVASVHAAVATSKTLELLLDVELPVCVSFGRAQLALKDVIKLTTGSIVELNRTISEPVEVIVNNCVIARGEVVVVEGNYGVRIQQVVSREERLRTLY
jgi:flagellar motor switch protein FliN/FliY